MPPSFSTHVPESSNENTDPVKGNDHGTIPELRAHASMLKMSLAEDLDDSALDTSSVDIPYLMPPGKETLRRRSDLQNPAYELHAIPSHLSERRGSRRASAGTSSAIRPIVIPEASLPPIMTKGDETPGVERDNVVIISGFTESSATVPALYFKDNDQVSPAQAARFRRNGHLQFAALCWCFFLEGWNDGSTGPLLPTIQAYYHVGFAVVSMIFVCNCVGFIVGAFLNVWLNDRIGFGKIMVIGSLCQLLTYIIQSPAPPFPVMVMATFLAGFGMSLQNAQANGFVGSLKEHMSTKLGVLHASYGLGALSAPLVATYFSGVRHWSFHYIISSGIAVSNTLVLCAVFRGRRQEDVLADAGQEAAPADAQTTERGKGLYRQILGIRTVHYLAIFALIYIGVEVTVGGWIVTFIIREREGGHSAGYISSGFFGGLALGRLSLMWVSRKVGEHRVIFLYAFLAIALEVTIWVVPSIIENAVAVSFIGLLLGPMFPIIVSHSSRVIPRKLLTGSVGWITGIGMAGSAALPFLTGLLASRFGIASLQPLLVSMMVLMVGLWALVPKDQRRVD